MDSRCFGDSRSVRGAVVGILCGWSGGRIAGSASGVLSRRVKDRAAVLTQCLEGCKRCKRSTDGGTDHRANRSNGNFTDDHEHKLISAGYLIVTASPVTYEFNPSDQIRSITVTISMNINCEPTGLAIRFIIIGITQAQKRLESLITLNGVRNVFSRYVGGFGFENVTETLFGSCLFDLCCAWSYRFYCSWEFKRLQKCIFLKYIFLS